MKMELRKITNRWKVTLFYLWNNIIETFNIDDSQKQGTQRTH